MGARRKLSRDAAHEASRSNKAPEHDGQAGDETGREALCLPEALSDPAVYGQRGPVELCETHGSWVFLVAEHAYKVKKPVAFPFLDYSTLAARRAACEQELSVNRELAPSIYLDVAALVQTPSGLRFEAAGAPGALEYAVHMRRYDPSRTLLHAVESGTLARAQIDALAARLRAFHERARQLQGDGVQQLLEEWRVNARELGELHPPHSWHVEHLCEFAAGFLARHRGEIARRVREGAVRDCHGDLRCEHVLLGEPIEIVDRIEFDPALRTMDVARELAFLTMDLEAHRHRAAARQLIGAYRDAGGNPGSERLRAFHAAYWALVRSKVALLSAASDEGRNERAKRSEASRLARLAERLRWRARSPLAIVICGPPASGKSTLAAELAARSGLAVVSSDLVRKRLAGVPPTRRAGVSAYATAFTRKVYAELRRDALRLLARTGGVIVDASCHRRSERAALLERLLVPGGTLGIVRCTVPRETALARSRARALDPQRVSDATPRVAAMRFDAFEPLSELPAELVLELDCEQPLEDQALAVERFLDGILARRAGDRLSSAQTAEGV